MNDEELEQHIRDSLDSRVQEPDELTRAALRAARYRALDQMPKRRQPWWYSGLAFAGVVLAVGVSWNMAQVSLAPDHTMNVAEDAAVIADLDLVLWLEGSDV